MRFIRWMLVLGLIISLGLNIFLFSKKLEPKPETYQEKLSNYPLLSPRILQEYHNDILINFIPLRKIIREEASIFGPDFGVYFEYLPTGVSIGVNEKELFKAASLIKVPAAMAYLHSQERRGDDTDKVVRIEKDQINTQFGNLWKRGEGAEVSLNEALELSLTQSDNTAFLVLAAHTPIEDVDDISDGLDLELGMDEEQISISAKGYASILKSLYFSSSLDEQNSQKILQLLTKSIYRDKLPAPIPSNVPIAHKIGVYKDNLFQDCGILYVPRRPYMLCMISKSSEEQARQRMIAISKVVYEYINLVNKD